MARILLVDDDPATLDVLEFSLSLDGHETARALDGRQGLDEVTRFSPDLVILDSMMPVMDGLTTARELRADPRTARIPIVMLTAKAMASDVWAGYQAGVDSYITKPLDLDVLMAEIGRLGVDTPTPTAEVVP